MPDEFFENPRSAAIYDAVDGPRDDLDLYQAVLDRLDAESVLDVGCGTGMLARRLAASGRMVIAADPAQAMLDVAQSEPGADQVEWHHRAAHELPEVQVDAATMTGNVAQVFVTDDQWAAALTSIRRCLRPGGHLMFETRDPARRAWEGWTRANTTQRLHVDDIGWIVDWVDVTDVALPLVTFDGVVHFEADGEEVRSQSTLRFRTRSELDQSLDRAGFDVVEVLDAPDRPGLEWVYVARARD